MATIKPIDGRTVHQIQSGQVIVDLCSVVKELVENSLDASATSIDVRFKNQGLEAIEVQDNGHGISSQNYETLALKHHTSKLSSYSDLTTLQTFGFRGEALSSLCAVSRFSVTTCLAADAPKGTKLEFATSGKLKGTSVVAAQRGTTVTVENLFSNLPVRRQELERNIKREWNRVTAVLGQYACIQTGIKFSVSSQAAKGKKTTLFSTKGNPSTRENIVNVFGAKTLAALIPLDLNLDLEPTSGPSQRWSTQEDGGRKEIRIVGHISRPASGEGRQLPDKQMVFVNSRPCGLPQVTKVFNEVYKSFNGTQSPFIFANIELDTHLYDVNVSPDKRTILLHDQSRMLENLKASLTVLFECQDYRVPISQLPAQKQPQYKQLTISGETARTSVTPQPIDEPNDGAALDSPAVSMVGQGDEEDDSETQERQTSGRATVSRDSMNRDREAVSLISNWVGRKAVERSISKDAPAKTVNEASAILEKWEANEEERGGPTQVSIFGDLANSTDSTQQSHVPAYEAAVPVTDFNKRLAEISEANTERNSEPDHPGPEGAIPALLSPSPMSSPGVASSVGSTTRLPKSPATLAMITVGDHTVTSSIGTPSFKRTRVEGTRNISRDGSGSILPRSTLPSFGSKLSQRFSAPGTQPSASSVENSADEIEPETLSRTPEQEVAGSLEDPDGVQLTREASPMPIATEGPGEEPSMPDAVADENTELDDEDGKKAREEAKVKEMIETAEQAATISSQENANRTKTLLRGGSRKKESTVDLVGLITTSTAEIGRQISSLDTILSSHQKAANIKIEDGGIDSKHAEDTLSLTISKEDFAKMRIIGQFNLGFILATRSSALESGNSSSANDLFIIDQHASDEKYNFERLQASTIVQSQRLVHPKVLQLTAVEEEVVIDNLKALETNGFIVTVDHSGESPVGNRCKLVSLPLSRETAFSTTDLEELLVLLSEYPAGTVPRPSKIRKMVAMRACRSSIMIGKTLTKGQMEKVVKHMGEIDKPWNCPHGRPTMRHVCGLGVWDDLGWREGNSSDGVKGASVTDWAGYIRRNRAISASP